jgi:hypothetical protein
VNDVLVWFAKLVKPICGENRQKNSRVEKSPSGSACPARCGALRIALHN